MNDPLVERKLYGTALLLRSGIAPYISKGPSKFQQSLFLIFESSILLTLSTENTLYGQLRISCVQKLASLILDFKPLTPFL